MKSEKIVDTARQAIKEVCFAVFDLSFAIWDFAAWMKEGSTLNG